MPIQFTVNDETRKAQVNAEFTASDEGLSLILNGIEVLYLTSSGVLCRMRLGEAGQAKLERADIQFNDSGQIMDDDE